MIKQSAVTGGDFGNCLKVEVEDRDGPVKLDARKSAKGNLTDTSIKIALS